MTGNLNLLARLHDLKIAEDVQEMANLGYFDTEFTMYGCAYLENGKRYYKISPNAADIYRFIEACNLKNVFPSNVVEYTKKCAVPAGMKEVIARDVKLELARQLSEDFPIEFFETLYLLADQVTNDFACDYLLGQVDALEGLFDIEALQRFENTLNYMFSCRRITADTFLSLHAWLKDERKSMLENFVSKDIFEKTMYGIMYLDNDHVRYIENARMEYVYKKIYDIERQGGVVTPAFEKTYWYNYRYRLADVVKDYRRLLRNVFTKKYLEQLETVRRTNRYMDLFLNTVISVEEKYGLKSTETLLRYGNRWGIYRRNVLKFTL